MRVYYNQPKEYLYSININGVVTNNHFPRTLNIPKTEENLKRMYNTDKVYITLLGTIA